MGADLGVRKGPIADINVTPLIDVVLVLLVVFMVITPLLSSGLPVDLPMATSTITVNDVGQHIVISVTRKGEWAVEQEVIDTTPQEGETEVAAKSRAKAELIAHINTGYAENPERSILVKADSKLEYGQVREVLDVLSENRFTSVFIAAGKEK
jgi:biopolymer transport protein TolR